MPTGIDEAPGGEVSRGLMLTAAFIAWMFAGLENQLFLLIHRQMILGLLGAETKEPLVTSWFAWFQVAFLTGGAVGGWLFGWLGDRFGRTRAMGWSVLCYSGFTFLCYFIPSAEVMWGVRLLACLGFGGAWPNAVALVSEAWPTASRPLLAGVMGSAANFGMVLMAAIAWFFPVTSESWRWALLVGALPAIPAVWILLFVPESVRWLQQRAVPRPEAGLNANTLVEVFRPPIRNRALLGILLGAIPVVGTAANANWVVPWTDQFEAMKSSKQTATPAGERLSTGDAKAAPGSTARKPDAGKKAITAMQRSFGAIFGSLLGGVLATLAGRRLSYFLISLLTLAMSTIVFGQLTPDHPQFSMATFLLGFFGVTYFGWLPLFLPELFPTRLRATGTGICFNTGRIISAVIVLMAAFNMASFQGDYSKVGLWSGLIYVLGMTIIWFAPVGPATAAEESP